MPCRTDLEKHFADFLDGAKEVVRYFKNERIERADLASNERGPQRSGRLWNGPLDRTSVPMLGSKFAGFRPVTVIARMRRHRSFSPNKGEA